MSKYICLTNDRTTTVPSSAIGFSTNLSSLLSGTHRVRPGLLFSTHRQLQQPQTQIPTQDVNGDGFADVLVGAWGASSAAGEILVVFGAADFPAVVVASDLDGSGGFVIRGATTSDAAGFSVDAAGVGTLLISSCSTP